MCLIWGFTPPDFIDQEPERLSMDRERAKKQGCFFCDEPITFPCVLWAGNGFDLVLHPGCAEKLTRRLALDRYDLEGVERGKVPTRFLLRDARIELTRKDA